MKRYPGIKPFTEIDSFLFFGRDKEIQELKTRINLDRLVTLYGKTGAGKTSLLRAGLTEELQNDDKHVLYVNFNIRQIEQFGLPSINIPLQIVENEIKRFCSKKSYIIEKVVQNENSLWYSFKKLQEAIGDKKHFVLILDQVEDLFMYSDKTVQGFKKQLAELLSSSVPQRFRDILKEKYDNNTFLSDSEIKHIYDKPQISVLLSVKSNKLSILNKLSDYLPDVLSNCYELPFLSIEQASDALSFPALISTSKLQEVYHMPVSPAFTINEAAMEDVLLFLSDNRRNQITPFQLQIAGQFIETKSISEKTEQLTPAHIEGVKNAVDNFYLHSIERLPNEEMRKNARKLFENHLVFEDQNVRVPMYEGIILKKFDKSLLESLIDLQLLEVGVNYYGDKYYEISSDSIINQVLYAKNESTKKRQENKFRIEKARLQRMLLVVASISIAVLSILLYKVNSQKNELEVREKFTALRTSVMQVENKIYNYYIGTTTHDLTEGEKQNFASKIQKDSDSLFYQKKYREAVLITENAIIVYKKLYFAPPLMAKEYSRLSHYLIYAGQRKKAYNFSKRAYNLDNTQPSVSSIFILSCLAMNKLDEAKKLYNSVKNTSDNNSSTEYLVKKQAETLVRDGVLPVSALDIFK